MVEGSCFPVLLSCQVAKRMSQHMIKGGGSYSSGLFLCKKAFSCVALLWIGTFFIPSLCLPEVPRWLWSPRRTKKLVFFCWVGDWKFSAFSFQHNVHLVSYQKVWRDWHVLCGGLMTAKSFTEGQYGKSWLGRGNWLSTSTIFLCCL